MIRPIYLYGAEVLRQQALPANLDDKEGLKQLIEDLKDTLVESEGCGLAAPQIGVPLRVLVVDGDVMTDVYDYLAGFKRVMINPVVLEGALAINPSNWRRDETYAPASANLGDRCPVFGEGDGGMFSPVGFETHRPGLADAQLDLERGVVVCTTTPERYIHLPPEVSAGGFGPASLHIADYTGYWDNIRENVRTRIESYFAKAAK